MRRARYPSGRRRPERACATRKAVDAPQPGTAAHKTERGSIGERHLATKRDGRRGGPCVVGVTSGVRRGSGAWCMCRGPGAGWRRPRGRRWDGWCGQIDRRDQGLVESALGAHVREHAVAARCERRYWTVNVFESTVVGICRCATTNGAESLIRKKCIILPWSGISGPQSVARCAICHVVSPRWVHSLSVIVNASARPPSVTYFLVRIAGDFSRRIRQTSDRRVTFVMTAISWLTLQRSAAARAPVQTSSNAVPGARLGLAKDPLELVLACPQAPTGP